VEGARVGRHLRLRLRLRRVWLRSGVEVAIRFCGLIWSALAQRRPFFCLEDKLMSHSLHIISSMATQQVLADLVALYGQQHALDIRLESVGGVDAAKRVQAGEAFDAVVLASNAIDQLLQESKLLAGSKVDLVSSGVAVAVRAGSNKPNISSEAAIKQAVLSAKTIGYSTGPSGVQLAKLFDRWGIAEQIKTKIITAAPGVPVGSLVAKGEVELGFQQLSELMNLPGIDVLGSLPDAIQITTIFSAAVAASSAQAPAVQNLLAFMASPAAEKTKRQNGMQAL
jgi:molybdate transport system substrate-binding protein